MPLRISKKEASIIERASPLAATGILSLGLLLPLSAAAEMLPSSTGAPPSAGSAEPAAGSRTVTFRTAGASEAVTTTAGTVADLLRERGITAADADYVNPGPQTPIEPGMTVEYRAAVEAQIVADGKRRAVRTSAGTVDALLRENGIRLAAADRITPSVTAPIESGTTITITRGRSWIARLREGIAAPLVRRTDPALPRGLSRVLQPGHRGTREVTLSYSQAPAQSNTYRRVLSSRILRPPQPRIVINGVGRFTSIAKLAQRGIDSTLRIAHSALDMVATAYSGDCPGCSGYTASGARAGVGVVAVDPAVIPLGTRLFIPGYGRAVAGDTGGAIRGRRIDLGFASAGDALRFGRRAVKVYVLQ